MTTTTANSTVTAYVPEYLERWRRPSNYIGASWSGYYRFMSLSRDSGALERSNFRSALAAIGGECGAADNDQDENPLVTVVEENHWAVGWIRWIAIHETATDALQAADRVMERLDNYPVVDGEDYSQEESEEAEQVWRDCYRPKDRLTYIREHAGQFDFRDFRDLLGCVRGKYFAGYAGELLN